MHIPSRLREQRRNMAASAPARAVEDCAAALAGFFIETAFRRARRANGELIEMKRTQLGSDLVGIVADVAEPAGRSEGGTARDR